MSILGNQIIVNVNTGNGGGSFNPVDYRGPLLAKATPTSPQVNNRFLAFTLADNAPSDFSLETHMGVANARLVEPHFVGTGVFGTVIDLLVDGQIVDTTIIELSDVDSRTLFAPTSIVDSGIARWEVAESKDQDGDYITIKDVGAATFTSDDIEFCIHEAIVSGVNRIETPAPKKVKGDLIAFCVIDGTYRRSAVIGGWQLQGDTTPVWETYEDANYQGALAADPSTAGLSTGAYYYRTTDNQWRGLFTQGLNLVWADWTLTEARAAGISVDLGERTDGQAAYDAISNFVATSHYFAFFDGEYKQFEHLALFNGEFYLNERSSVANAEVRYGLKSYSDTHLGYILELEREGEIYLSQLITTAFASTFGTSFGVPAYSTYPSRGLRIAYRTGLNTGIYVTCNSLNAVFEASEGITLKLYIAEN